MLSSSTKATLKLANSGQGGRALEADAGSGIAASLYSRNLGLSVISQANGIFIHAEALGGTDPRTVNFSVADGHYQVSCGRELVQEL